MFGNTPPVSQTIRIGGMRFDVIGVQHEKVQLSNYRGPDKESIFIPYTTAGQLWNTEYGPDGLPGGVADALDARATQEVRKTLAGRFRFNPADERALNIWGSADTQRIVGPIVLGLKVILTFIGVLTLTIGGVGVMNIMFVSVTERTREIGFRKALGARRGAILLQFLFEGLVTTFAGGAAGVLLSSVLVWALSPRPFLSEACSTMRAMQRTSPRGVVAGLNGDLHGDPDGCRPRQLVRAGVARLAPRSDRSASL